MVNAVKGYCPIRGGTRQVAVLQGSGCDATLAGDSELCVFGGLCAAQPVFAELFIRCEGKITRVGEELGPPYPSIVCRLDDLVRWLSYPVRSLLCPSAEERQSGLERLSSGDLSPDEAIELLSVE